MFTPKHIIFLVFCVFYIMAILMFTKGKSISFFVKWFLIIGIISETIKIFYFITTNDNGNYLPETDLPFHLCSIQILFLLILNISRNERINRLLLAFMIPSGLFGGVAALMIPTYSSINEYLIISIQYFLFHATLVSFSINLLRQKEIQFTMKDVFNVLKLLLFFWFVAIYINSMLGSETNVNFMYVVRPPVDDLPFLNLNQGYIIYILKYAILAVCLVFVSFFGVVKHYFYFLKSEKIQTVVNEEV